MVDAPKSSSPAMTGWVTLGNGGQRRLAGMGSRLAARILDAIIAGVVSLVVLFLVFGGLLAANSGEVGFLSAVLVIMLIWLLYEPVLIAVWGQTLGKKMVGVKVIRADNGEVPGYGKSISRWLVPSVVNLIPVIGSIISLVVYLSPVFSDTRQGWHDKAAATVVVTT